jgi:hypothetical protein
VNHISEDVIPKGILAQNDEEERSPPIVIVGGAIQHQRYENLDVDDGDGCGVNSGMLGLVGVEGGHAIRSGTLHGLAREVFTLALLASLMGLAVGFDLHCWRRKDQRREGIGR